MGFPQLIRVGELYQGLSNQAPWRQFPGQVKDILNLSLDISVGARVRSGTRLVSELTTPAELDFAFTVNDMRFYQFQEALIIIGSDPGTGDGFIKAFEVVNKTTFTERVVTGNVTYLDDSFKDTIRLTAIRDAILIMNREIVPQALTSANYTPAGPSLSTTDDLGETGRLEFVDTTNYVSGEDFGVGDRVKGVTSSAIGAVVSWTPASVGNPGSVLVVDSVFGTFETLGEDIENTSKLEFVDTTNYVGGEDFGVGNDVTGLTSTTTGEVVSWTPSTIGNPGSVLVVDTIAGTFESSGEDIQDDSTNAEITSADGGVGAKITSADAGTDPGASAGDKYYVETSSGSGSRGFYEADVNDPTTQDWTRVSAPQQDDAVLQGSSMPHQLLRQFDSDFDYTITVGGPFTVGETITGGTSGATGTVRSVGPGDRITAELTSAPTDFQVAETITGGGSGTQATVDAYFPSSVLSFQFSEVVWEERLSGTENSNPSPVWAQTSTNDGAPLDAMEFHSGRLFLIGANAVTFSDARDRVQFFLDDVTDDIPLFVATGSVDINAPSLGEIQWALSATNNLMILGENGQITFTSGQEQLSSLNGVVEPVESFNNSTAIPTTTGGRVTMVDEFGDVRDFIFDPVSLFMGFEGNRASHALQVLQGVETFQVFTFDDFTFFVGDDDTRLHQFTTVDGTNVQSAWSKLRFPGAPVFMWQWEDKIYILERDTDRAKWVVLNYVHRQEPLPAGFCFAPAMDYMRDLSVTSYDSGNNETEFLYTNAGLKTKAVLKDTFSTCRNEWWDIPDPTTKTLVELLNAALDVPVAYDLDENQVVDEFDVSANQNIIGGAGVYDGGGNQYNMTKTYSSNLFTDGAAIAVSSGSGKNNVIDGDTATFWQSAGGDANPTIVYDFGSSVDAKDLIRYRIGATATDKPVSWTFEGSNNGLSYTVLDTQSSQSFSDFEIKEYDLANLVNYRFYRLRDIVDVGGAPGGAQLSEWLGFELASNDIDIESDALPATITPNDATIVVIHDDTIATDTEIQAFVSRDAGATFLEIILSLFETRLDGKTVLTGKHEFDQLDLGTSVKWKVTVTGDQNLNDASIHGVALQWFDLRDGASNQILTPDRILSDRFFVNGDHRGEYTIGETYDWFMLLTELYPDGATNQTPIISKVSFWYVNSFEFDFGIKRKALLESDAYIRTFSTGNVGSTTVDGNSIKTGSGMFSVGLDGRSADIIFRGIGPVPTTLSAIEYAVRMKGKNLGFGGQGESFA